MGNDYPVIHTRFGRATLATLETNFGCRSNIPSYDIRIWVCPFCGVKYCMDTQRDFIRDHDVNLCRIQTMKRKDEDDGSSKNRKG